MSFQIEFLERLESDLRSAATSRSRGRRWRGLAPSALLVAVAVMLTSGSLALAFGGRVLDALTGKPAPGTVKSEFRQMTKPLLPADGAPPVPKALLPGTIVRGSEHQVAAVRNSRGKLARLYVARTTRGRVCTLAVGWPFGGAGCWGPVAARSAIAYAMYTSTVRRAGPHSPYAYGVTGRAVSPRAATLRLVYPDGSHTDLRLVDGWFMYELPVAHSSAATGPVRADVLAASGARLGTLADPFQMHRARPHFTFPVPSSIRPLVSADLPNSGGIVTIWSGRDAAGHNCFRHLRNGTSQQFPAWECGAMVGHSSYPPYPAGEHPKPIPLRWEMGLRNDNRHPTGYGYAYATGWAAPRVTRLTVRYQDGSATDIPLHGRYYLYVVPPANWVAGHRPSILEERDAAGALVYRLFLYPRQHCIYPGRDPLCVNHAMGTG